LIFVTLCEKGGKTSRWYKIVQGFPTLMTVLNYKYTWISFQRCFERHHHSSPQGGNIFT